MGTDGGARHGRRRPHGHPTDPWGDLVDVEVVDDDVPAYGHVPVPVGATSAAGAPAAPPGPAPEGPTPSVLPYDRPGRTRRHWGWWAVAVALVLVVGGGVVETASRRVDEAAVASFAGVPGVVGSLREPLSEHARFAGSDVRGVAAGIVLSAAGPTGGELVAQDALTGAELWRVPSPAAEAADLHCAGESPDTPLVCQSYPTGEGGANTDAVLGEVPGVLVVLGREDGAVLGRWPVPAASAGWAPIDGDVVTGRSVPRGLLLERLRPAEDEPVWSAVIPLDDAVVAGDLWLEVVSGLVLVQGRVAAAVDGADGRTIGVWPSPGPVLPSQVTVAGGGFIVWDGTGRGVWHDRDGRPGAELQGRPADPAVRDTVTLGGAAPPAADEDVVLVTTASTLRAVDVADGVELWRRPTPAQVVLRVAGSLVLVDDGEILVLDVRTGDERWSRPGGLADPLWIIPVSDGVRVLVPGYEVETGRYVTAYELADGDMVWRSTLPDGVIEVAAVGGLVVGRAVDDLIVLG